jgi:uncharacterized protein
LPESAAIIITMSPFMYTERALDLSIQVQRKSCFLFGPRHTGKTSLIRHTLKSVPVYNLLDPDVYLKLSRSPLRLREDRQAEDGLVVIDEIQKLPQLLDVVHMLIEEDGIRFLLTGSSARKVRRGGVNLLGGRALVKQLHPLSARELGKSFDLGMHFCLTAAGRDLPGLTRFAMLKTSLEILKDKEE